MTLTVREFHAARRMFIVKGDTVLVAPAGSVESHAGWLMSLEAPLLTVQLLGSCVRGYVFDGRLVAYIGQDFAAPTNHRAVCAALDVMGKLYRLEEVGLGIQCVSGVRPWPCQSLYSLDRYFYLFRELP